MKTASIISRDGNITLIQDCKSYSIGKDHLNYAAILAAIKNKQDDLLPALLDVPKIISAIEGISVNDNGDVTFNGSVLHNTVVDRIRQFMQGGLPFEPLVSFLKNLMKNPSGRSISELYGFLEHRGLPITDDGHFIAYKGIRNDWKDVHSGTIDNSIGQKPRFERNKVDDNCNNTCSYGLHVGTLEYASIHAGSTGRVVLVKVDPADCVSVPTDHNASKLRVCSYEVVGLADKLLETPTYSEPNEKCDDCGDTLEDCDCQYCSDCNLLMQDCRCDLCEDCEENLDDCVCDEVCPTCGTNCDS